MAYSVGAFTKFRLKRVYMQGYQSGQKKIESGVDQEALSLGATDASEGRPAGASFDDWYDQLVDSVTGTEESGGGGEGATEIELGEGEGGEGPDEDTDGDLMSRDIDESDGDFQYLDEDGEDDTVGSSDADYEAFQEAIGE